jgi:sulfur carrier protein
MKLTINGERVELEREMSIADFLKSRNVSETLVGVEHNLTWVRREDWTKIILQENDRLEIIRIMAGG